MMAQNEQTTEEHKRRSSTHFVEVYTLHVFFATLHVVSRTTRRWPVRDGDGNGNRGRKTDSTPFGLLSSALVCFTMTCLSLASRSYVDQILTRHLPPPLHTSTPPRNYYRGYLPLVGRGQMSAKLLLFILKLVQWYKRR